MRVLGIDTATRRASVGLLTDGEVVVETFQNAASNHAVSLLPLIDDTLRQAGCSVDELDAVAVSSGPGSFSGLRVGVSVAKGIGLATGTRVIAVSTLEALARTISDRRGAICALLDARKGELYAACFTASDDGLTRLTADELFTPDALLAYLPTPCVILGDAVATYGDWLQDRLGERVTLLPYETHGPRGGIVARLGWERWQSGARADLASLEPIYVRPSDAERNSV